MLKQEDVEVIGAADRLPLCRENAQKTLDEVGAKGTELVEEYDDLLAMKPDAIVVATNGKMQAEHSCRALEAGCHVLSEIPGARTLEEWVRVRDVVQRTGNTYTLAEQRCFMDFLRYWRKWIVDGRLGAPSLAEAEYTHYLPQTLALSDGTRIKPSEAREKGIRDVKPIWRADEPPIQYCTHDLGPLLEVMDDRCVSVTCLNGPWRNREAPLRPDGQIALFRTAKGNLIRILIALNTPRPSEHRYRLFATGGSAEWFASEGHVRVFTEDRDHKSGWQRIDLGVAAPGEDATGGHGGSDLKMARCFVDVVLHGRPNPIDVYRAIEYALPGIMANRSAETGGMPIEIPDLRVEPFSATTFWDAVPLPEQDVL